MVNSGHVKHAFLGGSGGPPQKIFESKCPEIDSGGPSSCDSTCTCKLPVKSVTVVIGTGEMQGWWAAGNKRHQITLKLSVRSMGQFHSQKL